MSKFPPPLVRQAGYLYWRRADLENYKRALIAAATGSEPEPFQCDVETFAPAATVAAEFGWSRRTLGRRIAEYTCAEKAEVQRMAKRTPVGEAKPGEAA